MIRGLDSSFDRPTPAILAQARAAGVRVWGGYLPPGVGLASPWDRASFQTVQNAGMVALGFASGNDDPAQVAAIARSWGVLGCLDDEDGIRATTGGWQQAWLDASGFGLYGGLPRHTAVRARFHIAALYPGADPGATWPPGTVYPTPTGPLGWQWQGTHTEFGLSVDSLWLDDWFGLQGGQPMRLETARPDGGRDIYVLVGSTLQHTIVDFQGFGVNQELLPGQWAALVLAGYRGLTAFVKGLGMDLKLYELTNSGGGWVGP